MSPSLAFDASYESLINRYFSDVQAASSPSAANVYSVDTQYYDGPAPHVHIQYSSTFGGSYVSHDPLPPSGCDDTFDTGAGIISDPFCLTDQQLQNEIQHVLTVNGWHGGLSNMFFLMTPAGVGSCVLAGDVNVPNQACSTNVFCAYHNYFVDTSSENVIYANEPYEFDGCNDTGDGQGFPNDPNADTTISTISHEHNEAITDPLTDPSSYGWLAADGSEIGDLCAYTYGGALGAAANGQPYNQLINGHDYSIQQEWSNADSGCVLRLGGAASPPNPLLGVSGPLKYLGGPVMHTNTTYAIYWAPTPGNTAVPAVAGTTAVNQTLTTSVGTWDGGATSFAYQWQRCSSAGAGCVNIPGATASSYTLTSADGGNTVRSTVSATNVNGASPYAASATTALVVPLPAASAGPVVSGIAGVGKSLSTTGGTWNTPVSLAYQWLRCAADGTGCAAIPAATANTYPLVDADAGHRLEVVVSATDVAGTGSATSAATAVVVTVPAVTGAPRIAGKARIGKRLSASPGTWTWSPTTYGYQWLRCSRAGGRCVAIRNATRTSYRITKRDAGHRLRLRVTATNAAGAGSATSHATQRVPLARHR